MKFIPRALRTYAMSSPRDEMKSIFLFDRLCLAREKKLYLNILTFSGGRGEVSWDVDLFVADY